MACAAASQLTSAPLLLEQAAPTSGSFVCVVQSPLAAAFYLLQYAT